MDGGWGIRSFARINDTQNNLVHIFQSSVTDRWGTFLCEPPSQQERGEKSKSNASCYNAERTPGVSRFHDAHSTQVAHSRQVGVVASADERKKVTRRRVEIDFRAASTETCAR